MSTPVEISPILTLEEIFSLYPDEWVLIAYTELDEDLSVIRGEVLAHNGKSVAIEYTGLIPDNLVMIL
ncbi:MAG: hypothetical protein EAZ79_02180 [Oscillatoriales cyanobacterium]|nr:MAG: hypothetical protein EAZ79_02180 [Oscillatoriales cyanobacterium]